MTFRGVRIGSETITVTRSSGEFAISARGQIAAPLDLITTKFDMTYSLDWQPKKLSIEGALRNQTLALNTSFSLTTAISDIVQGTERRSTTHDISPKTIVLPPSYFAAYEILAARLPSFAVGSRFPVYLAPEAEVTAIVNKVTPRRIVSPEATTDLREYDLTLNRPGAAISVLVSIDSHNRLAKVVFGEQGFAAIRDDISTVRSREERIRNAGDSDVYIPVSGFSLAGTITVPPKANGRMPAVVLIGGQGAQDRDETRYGISIFGQMAGRLADAGFVVLRYDRRGIGQSGGRPEHAGVTEYALDVLDAVRWLRRRADVDPKRVVLVSHDDGVAVALTAAGRDSRIAGVAVMGGPGLTGRATVMAQQQLSLARINAGPAERDSRVVLQQRINEAVITGKGWESLPTDVRRLADTVWFRTWLLFDPAVALKKVDQPLLILHGSLDKEIPVTNSDALENAAKARKNAKPMATQKVVLPGVNHLLLTARTGEMDEYDSLPDQVVSPALVDALVAWLRQTVK